MLLSLLAFVPACGDTGAGMAPAGAGGAGMGAHDDITARLQQESREPVQVLKHIGRETARVVSGWFPVAPLGLPAAASSEEKARAFLRHHADVFGPGDVNDELVLRGDHSDQLGMHHVTFGQVVGGVEVHDAIVNVHFGADGSHVSYVSSSFVPDARLASTTPRISAEDALTVARRGTPSRALVAPTLVVYAGPGDRHMPPRLAWRVDVTNPETSEQARYFVDAEGASVLDRHSRSRRITAPKMSANGPSASRPRAALPIPGVKPPHPLVFASSPNRKTYISETGDDPACTGDVCSDDTDPETEALNTNMGIVISKFAEKFGRYSYNSYDGGPPPEVVISVAHYWDTEEPGQSNAFWSNGRFLFTSGMPKLDIVAHEFTHAVDQFTANLGNRGQSGALAESFADIFATYVNSEANNSDIWKVGTGTPAEVHECKAMRDISYPEACAEEGDPAPSTTAGYQHLCDDNDDGGVHINSGIVSHAYYNIAVALGRTKAARIFYRALVGGYLLPTSGLEDAHSAAYQAAIDLYATTRNGVRYCTTECSAVRDGFAAVGLDGSWQAPSEPCSPQAYMTGHEAFAPNLVHYLGCYTDDASRALPVMLLASGATVESCTSAARRAGYRYAGLQNGGQCFAGKQAGYSKVSDSECNYACSANTAEMCGGYWRNAVWSVPHLGQYQGCFVDSIGALPFMLAPSGATVGSCTIAAQQAGFPYAGLRYGGQCLAGYDTGSSKVSDSECNYACDANTAEACGSLSNDSIWYVPPGDVAPLTLSGLVGHWALDADIGDSGRSGAGTACGISIDVGSGNSRSAGCPSLFAAGVVRTAASFDGVNDFLPVNNNISGSFTVSAWIKTTTAGAGTPGNPAYAGTGIVWSDISGAAPDMIPLALVGDRAAFGTGEQNGGGYDTLTSTVPVTTGSWVHLAVTRDMSTGAKQMFVNGALDGSSTGSTGTLDANAIIALGANPLDNRYFNGALDDVQFYDRALTPNEVQAIYFRRAPNLALHKPTLQSSTYTVEPWAPGPASAVDGNTDGVFSHSSVTHTNLETQPWWQVDLESVQHVSSVVIWNRTDCCSDRLRNFDLILSDDGINWRWYGYDGTAPARLEFPIHDTARWVKVRLRDGNFLSLAEVEVLGY